MGLVPEFFMVLGIFFFLAMSFLSALLDEDLPSILQYVFQGAAAVGLGLLLMNQALVNGGIFSVSPTDPTRLSVSVIYLGSAIFIAAGLNLYLAIIRRNMALSTILSGAVTVPTCLVSAILVSSFIGTGGEIIFTSTTILIIALSASLISLSIFGVLHEAHKQVRFASSERGSLPPILVSTPSVKGEDDWEKSLKHSQ